MALYALRNRFVGLRTGDIWPNSPGLHPSWVQPAFQTVQHQILLLTDQLTNECTGPLSAAEAHELVAEYGGGWLELSHAISLLTNGHRVSSEAEPITFNDLLAHYEHHAGGLPPGYVIRDEQLVRLFEVHA